MPTQTMAKAISEGFDSFKGRALLEVISGPRRRLKRTPHEVQKVNHCARKSIYLPPPPYRTLNHNTLDDIPRWDTSSSEWRIIE